MEPFTSDWRRTSRCDFWSTEETGWTIDMRRLFYLINGSFCWQINTRRWMEADERGPVGDEVIPNSFDAVDSEL